MLLAGLPRPRPGVLRTTAAAPGTTIGSMHLPGRSDDAERLSTLDAAFLEMEDAVPGAHMHLGAVLLLGPVPGRGGPPRVEELRELLAARLPELPRFDQRLSSPRADGLRRPHWVVDHFLRIDHHVRRAALPDPGGQAELEAWCGEFFSQPLDRAHPLWEAVLVERLPAGRSALAVKIHHCLADGMGSIALADLVADRAPGAALRRPPAAGPAEGGHRRPAATVALAEDAARLALHPDRALAAARGVAEMLRDGLLGPTETAISGPVGRQRSFTTIDVPLGELREIERQLGGTVNDAVLAIVGGGLRRLLRHRGDALPEEGICAMVPVDVRDPAAGSAGNRISSLFVPLPVAVDGPEARHAAIRAATATRKRGGQSSAVGALVALSGLAPPVLHQALVRLAITPRLFRLTVTNVRGPRARMTVLGAPVRAVQPFVPLGPDHRVGVALITYAGRATFGIVADADAIPDVDVLAAGMQAEHVALRRAARRVSRASRAAARRRRSRRGDRAAPPAAPAARR